MPPNFTQGLTPVTPRTTCEITGTNQSTNTCELNETEPSNQCHSDCSSSDFITRAENLI